MVITLERCGYCRGTGQTEVPPYDGMGRAVPARKKVCEYCGGFGACEAGEQLEPLPTAAERLERAGITAEEHAADLSRAGNPAWA